MWKYRVRATLTQFPQNQAQERFALDSAPDLYFLDEEPPDPAHSNTGSPPPQRFVRRLKNLFFLHSPSFDPKRDVFVWRISFGLPLEKVSIPTTAVISILTFVFLGYYVSHLIHLTLPESSLRRLENLFFLHSLSFDPRGMFSSDEDVLDVPQKLVWRYVPCERYTKSVCNKKSMQT